MKILLLITIIALTTFAQTKPVQVASALTPNGKMSYYVGKVEKKGDYVTFDGYVERIENPSPKPFELSTEFKADCKTNAYMFVRTKGTMQGAPVDHKYEKNVQIAEEKSAIWFAIKYACTEKVETPIST